MGDLIRAHLRSAGVSVLTDDQAPPTPTAIVTLDERGSAAYEFAIEWSLRQAAVPPARYVHLGSLASVLEPGADTARRLLRELRRSGATVSYNPNIRPALFGEREDGIAAVEECVALSHVVKASDSVPAALRAAAAAAAITVSRAGANPPTAAELTAALRS
ncbi:MULTISPECIES: hypothetical protein [unclassified Kitasatospora]|uniref:hypothetical protein n=1 Tax=unclassified Kitasatospora TaxID=2633591 RepID=UPI00070BB318|nr:hypothetical protein ASC99_08550 [Kitasatospora sp. Root107]KRB75285.1 hypothetical protein ASE03_14855 [Kitasatospora sp. Root187]